MQTGVPGRGLCRLLTEAFAAAIWQQEVNRPSRAREHGAKAVEVAPNLVSRAVHEAVRSHFAACSSASDQRAHHGSLSGCPLPSTTQSLKHFSN